MHGATIASSAAAADAGNTRSQYQVDEEGRAVVAEVVLQADGTERTVDVSSRAYEKLVCPAFPQYGDMKNWMTQLKRNVVACAPYTDMAEIKWLNECYTKTFEELIDAGSARMKRLDLVLSKCLVSASPTGS